MQITFRAAPFGPVTRLAAKLIGPSILCAAVMLGVIGSPAGARQGAESPPPNPLKTDAAALVIRMLNSVYVPDTGTIKIGQVVRFENGDTTGHTATALDGSFDSGYLAKGDSYQTTFTEAAKIRFSDLYHPSMHGTITIVK